MLFYTLLLRLSNSGNANNYTIDICNFLTCLFFRVKFKFLLALILKVWFLSTIGIFCRNDQKMLYELSGFVHLPTNKADLIRMEVHTKSRTGEIITEHKITKRIACFLAKRRIRTFSRA